MILLNGPSSAGKSTLSGELQRRLAGTGVEAEIISIDDYMITDPKETIYEDDIYEIMPAMCEEMKNALGKGRSVIVDHAITSERIFEAFMDAAKGYEVLTVKVTCDLEILLRREQERGDRCPGSAEASLQYLWPKEGYDLCVDSGKCSAVENAEIIMDAIEMCQKEPSKAWNAKHSMIPTERRDVTKVTPVAHLEKMGEFFDARLEGYEEHQLTTIDDAGEFYPFTAGCLPQDAGACILDLGCGTGLELGYYFEVVPTAKVTGVDLAAGMLDALKKKFPEKALNLIVGSYFDVPFEEGAFDAAVSVESLHHFTKEEKIPLYEKVRKALKADGYFILTDYFATSEEEERFHRGELLRLRKEQGLREDEFYHYDTPLTVEHETEALLAAGFKDVQVLKNWGHTYTLKAAR
ncbi:MAG: methyltransferase domain-containing protein [Acetatifactor sp.]|nr:methyltransferase domain-containing protein [Acetatifactor sp.]